MKVHYLHKYLRQPEHPITITVVGCGGTGSYVVTQLAKMALALEELNGIQIHVTVIDDDIVEKHNTCRQLFSKSDIGLYKSNVIVSRVNRFFGLDWVSVPKKINDTLNTNIVITCVDNVKARRIFRDTRSIKSNKIHEPFKRRYYWMDFGNSKDYGQYVLSSFVSIPQPNVNQETESKMKNLFELFGNIKEVKDEPSCSMAQSLNEQDLFINLQLATAGVNLLWKLLKEHRINYQGQFLNSSTGNTRPINI